MKKAFWISLICFQLYGFGQSIVVTPNGLRDASDTSSSFVVLKLDSMNAKSLYDNAIRYIIKNYKNSDEVIKGKIDGEYIKYGTYVPNITVYKHSPFHKYAVNCSYTTEMNFKDGKIKYEVIEVDMTFVGETGTALPFEFIGETGFTTSTAGIFNKKGELKREINKTDIEKYFNTAIKNILTGLSVSDNQKKDNW